MNIYLDFIETPVSTMMNVYDADGELTMRAICVLSRITVGERHERLHLWLDYRQKDDQSPVSGVIDLSC